MLLSCRDLQHWRGRCLSLQEAEFGEPAVVRRFMPAYDVARVVRTDAIVFFSLLLFVSFPNLLFVSFVLERHSSWVCIYASLALAKV